MNTKENIIALLQKRGFSAKNNELNPNIYTFENFEACAIDINFERNAIRVNKKKVNFDTTQEMYNYLEDFKYISPCLESISENYFNEMLQYYLLYAIEGGCNCTKELILNTLCKCYDYCYYANITLKQQDTLTFRYITDIEHIELY